MPARASGLYTHRYAFPRGHQVFIQTGMHFRTAPIQINAAGEQLSWARRDEAGAPWAERLRASCRQEFEQARHETDPALISRMLIVGRDAIDQTLERYRARAEQLLVEQGRGDGGDGGGPRGK